MSDVFGVGKAIEKLMDPVSELVKKLAGPAAEEVGLSLQDSVKVWRAKRQYKLFEKMNTFIADAGFEPNPIGLKLLLPALDCAAVEDDESLHSMWAALLANAADPRQLCIVHPSFTTILKELTSREVKLLDALYRIAVAQTSPPWVNKSPSACEFTTEDVIRTYCEIGLSQLTHFRHITQGFADQNRATVDEDERNFAMSMDVLTRNRLIDENYRVKTNSEWDTKYLVSAEVKGTFVVTDLAVALMQACAAPKKSAVTPPARSE